MAEVKPAGFIIGVIDFVSILVPGALRAFAVQDVAGGAGALHLNGEVHEGAAFLVVAYILRHFVFALASTLDGWLYDGWYVHRRRHAWTVGWLTYAKTASPHEDEWRWARWRRRSRAWVTLRRLVGETAEQLAGDTRGLEMTPDDGKACDEVTITG